MFSVTTLALPLACGRIICIRRSVCSAAYAVRTAPICSSPSRCEHPRHAELHHTHLHRPLFSYPLAIHHQFSRHSAVIVCPYRSSSPGVSCIPGHGLFIRLKVGGSEIYHLKPADPGAFAFSSHSGLEKLYRTWSQLASYHLLSLCS